MTSRQYDDYCRVNALLKKMRHEELTVLSYAVRKTLMRESNLYFKDALGKLLVEINCALASCVVD